MNIHQIGSPVAVKGLGLASNPSVPAGGVFFLYDPDQGRLAGGFLQGDVMLMTTTNWREVRFLDNRLRSRTEVRYGDVDDPENAAVIASVDNVASPNQVA
ncbi:hypothetical protein ACWGLF_45785 [Streptomyces puniciscabiei]